STQPHWTCSSPSRSPVPCWSISAVSSCSLVIRPSRTRSAPSGSQAGFCAGSNNCSIGGGRGGLEHLCSRDVVRGPRDDEMSVNAVHEPLDPARVDRVLDRLAVHFDVVARLTAHI